MNLSAASIYWVIVALWLAVLGVVATSYVRNLRASGSIRLLLAVVAIDAVRNIIEAVYFGASYGFFAGQIVGVLGDPDPHIIAKLADVAVTCAVLGLLLLRWLPTALRNHADTEDHFRQKAELLKQESEERRRLFETSLDLIFVTDRRGNLIRVSPSSAATLGYSPDEMIGRSAGEFIYHGDLERTRGEMRLARAGQQTRNFETRYIHKDGRVVTLAWSGVWSEPEQRHFFFGRDMTERKVAEEKLKYLAHYDQLTGLPNRASLRRDLGEFINLCSASDGHATSIAMFDLDGFKDINDTLGHSTGDQLLQEVAKRLVGIAKDGPQVYRLGGDEFVLIFPDCGDPRIVAQVVESLLKRLGESFEINGQRLCLSGRAQGSQSLLPTA